MPIYEDVLYRVEDGVAVVTLNRPDKLNAWRTEMDRDVRLAMRAASDDPAVRLIVLTGAGRGFCAGADMKMLTAIPADGGREARPGSRFASQEPWDARANPNFQKQ